MCSGLSCVWAGFKMKVSEVRDYFVILVLPFAALTVRFLTRRFIGEYGDMGEC